MNILKYIKSCFEVHPFTGVIPDDRDKSNDVQHQEVAEGATVTWTEKLTWKKYTKRFQNGSGSCVAQTNAKCLEVEGFAPRSAVDIYARRSNQGAGMIPYEAIQLTCTYGVTSEALIPSQNMTDQEMDSAFLITAADTLEENKTKGGIPVVLPIDIDAIAEVLDRGIPVSLCFSFYGGEWTDVPSVMNLYRGIHHAVAAVDRTLYQGKKALIIEDSAFPTTATSDGQRIITEEYLLARCTFAGYRLRTVSQPSSKPNHIFTQDMRFGDKNNEVKLLQDRLKFEGVFDTGIPSTGYFGVITKQAVVVYQQNHNLPNTGFCGPMTRKVLNA